mmetsp:Transcript_100709/g.200073  ORF Transcript_100709/g.200073 Transcript_100709/m.200073 type:complete len:80 (-) Transcript_100709:108-347(-)
MRNLIRKVGEQAMTSRNSPRRKNMQPPATPKTTAAPPEAFKLWMMACEPTNARQVPRTNDTGEVKHGSYLAVGGCPDFS